MSAVCVSFIPLNFALVYIQPISTDTTWKSYSRNTHAISFRLTNQPFVLSHTVWQCLSAPLPWNFHATHKLVDWHRPLASYSLLWSHQLALVGSRTLTGEQSDWIVQHLRCGTSRRRRAFIEQTLLSEYTSLCWLTI